MRRLAIAFGAVLAAAALGARELDLNGDLREIGPDGLPAGWRRSAFAEFQPYAKCEVRTEADGVRALHVHAGDAPGGAQFCSRRFAAAAGDRVVFTAKAKGAKYVWVAVQVFSGKRWGGWLKPYSYCSLTEDWQDMKAEIAVRDLKGLPTDGALLVVGLPKGAELRIKDIRAAIEGK